MMSEKLANSAAHLPILGLTRRVGSVLWLTFTAMLMIWGLDNSKMNTFTSFWRYPKRSHSEKLANSQDFNQNYRGVGSQLPHDVISSNFTVGNHTLDPEINSAHVNSDNKNGAILSKIENPVKNVRDQAGLGKISSGFNQGMPRSGNVDPGPVERDPGRVTGKLDWVVAELEENYSSNLLARWTSPGGQPCKDSYTVGIKFLNLDDGKAVNFPTGYAHEIVFQALDESGNDRCLGGDYFELDLSGESWKSRPPIKDLGNGTYSFILQVHPKFAGDYELKVILLFRHFEGLKYSSSRFGYDKELRRIRITFSRSEARLPELHTCTKSDFRQDVWAGRWTRHARNDPCEISNDGRYRCLEPYHPCTIPWCSGSLGLLESNGWVYSAHCSFKLFTMGDAWNCLNNRWLFFWGDSNHVDTIRNLVFFFLGVPFEDLQLIKRRFDMNFTNPKDQSQSVRITNIFNGHWEEDKNYQGLHSLSDAGHRDVLKGFFNGSTVPDTVIFNSGLHDGIYWPNIRQFVGGAEYAASFWSDLMQGVKMRGLEVPNFIFRSTITTGGYARTLSFNPSKLEAFNGILLEKLKAVGLVTGVVDSFDMTWAWHFDNRCNDGVHYGRFPVKLKWRDGQIGHQYFVDLMLGHVLLNAICSK